MEQLSSKIIRRLLCTHLFIKNFILQKSNDKTIYLTFDDGPTSAKEGMHTETLLSLLEKYNISASFFVLGQQLTKNKSLAKKLIEAGHNLGNHTNSHQDISQLPYKEFADEIKTCQHLINQLDPNAKYLFRPPRGHINSKNLFFLFKKKYKIVLWSIDSMDSHNWNVEDIITRLKKKKVAGKILLFHDDSDIATEVLEELIPFWIDQGLSFSKL